MLEWASKRGYKETGGGLWGELDGENAQDLTRQTRYFVLTVRDMETKWRVLIVLVDVAESLVIRSRMYYALDSPTGFVVVLVHDRRAQTRPSL